MTKYQIRLHSIFIQCSRNKCNSVKVPNQIQRNAGFVDCGFSRTSWTSSLCSWASDHKYILGQKAYWMGQCNGGANKESKDRPSKSAVSEAAAGDGAPTSQPAHNPERSSVKATTRPSQPEVPTVALVTSRRC